MREVCHPTHGRGSQLLGQDRSAQWNKISLEAGEFSGFFVRPIRSQDRLSHSGCCGRCECGWCFGRRLRHPQTITAVSVALAWRIDRGRLGDVWDDQLRKGRATAVCVIFGIERICVLDVKVGKSFPTSPESGPNSVLPRCGRWSGANKWAGSPSTKAFTVSQVPQARVDHWIWRCVQYIL